MALILVLCVGVNYAIFLVEGHGREGTAFTAVALSAVTTLLSFGLLAFSGTPASISAKDPEQTAAMEELPLLSIVSALMRTAKGQSLAGGMMPARDFSACAP